MSADWETLQVNTRWFLGGFTAWLLIFCIFPRPIRTYVLGHELTHALWGLFMGARVSKLRISSKGGSVNLTKTNVWITLAPYFFPFYMVLALIAFVLTSFLIEMQHYMPLWFAIFGMTWSFHITFTIIMLTMRQPDIHEHGRLFSCVLIYCINVATATFLINFLTTQSLTGLASFFWQETQGTYEYCFNNVIPWIQNLVSKVAWLK
ncbi:MAG TPA: hypothetical protein PJ991_03930 [Kiritimatiellia bacterium]|nr:hypothetical protein [Kiritimatiellia bacterium]